MIYPLISAWIYILFVTFLIVASTYVVTRGLFILRSRPSERHIGKEPPTAPYFIPWIGNALPLIWDTNKFLASISQLSSDDRPIKIKLANEKSAYVITGAKNIQHIFKASKDLTFDEFSLKVMQQVKKCPKSDSLIFAADKSGIQTTPWVTATEDTRIWRGAHVIYQNNLTGIDAVNSLMARFVDEFTAELASIASGKWMEVPINKLLEDKMFRASTKSLAGNRIFELSPNFTADFWDYDASFMMFLYGLPKFCFPKGWQARERVFKAVKIYLESAWQRYDWQSNSPGLDWEENFGAKLVRKREALFAEFGISLDGRAANELGLIWSINSNAIPMVSWILIEVISDSNLLSRVQREITSATITNESGTKLDIQRVLALPLLNSCYSECMRLRASVQVVRELRHDIQLDGYTLKGGNIVMAPAWLAHYDDSTWSSDGHPADTFWADRFLKKIADGGIMKECDNEGIFFNPANTGQFFPYGGGVGVCPGRHYAKAEMLVAVAMFILTFEVQALGFVDNKGRPSSRRPSMGKETRGTMRLDRDLKVRIRKRGLITV